MTNQNNPYRITETFGDKPFQISTGENADGDQRYRIDVTYTSEERRRVWLSRKHLEEVYTVLGRFLYPGPDDESQPDVMTNSQFTDEMSEPPF